MTIEPVLPFFRLNKYHVVGFRDDHRDSKLYSSKSLLRMYRSDFEIGRFKENACVIDINCNKFPILDVVCVGPYRDLWDIFANRDLVQVRYIFGLPVQLTFEQAREEVVELICSRRWFSKTQDRESQKQFRERMALCENMQDLILGREVTDPIIRKRFQWVGAISFYGEWVG